MDVGCDVTHVRTSRQGYSCLGGGLRSLSVSCLLRFSCLSSMFTVCQQFVTCFQLVPPTEQQILTRHVLMFFSSVYFRSSLLFFFVFNLHQTGHGYMLSTSPESYWSNLHQHFTGNTSLDKKVTVKFCNSIYVNRQCCNKYSFPSI